MALVRADNEGTTVDADVVQGGEYPNLSVGSGTIKYSDLHVFSGTRSVKLSQPNAAGTAPTLALAAGLNTTKLAVTIPGYWSVKATADDTLCYIRDTANTRVLSVTRNANNLFRVFDQKGSSSTANALFVGTVDIPLNAVMKVWIDVTNNKAKAALYNRDTGALLDSVFSADASTTVTSTTRPPQLGTVNLDRIQLTTTANVLDVWYDGAGYDVAATDLLADYGAAAAALSLTGSFSLANPQPSGTERTLNLIAAGGNGNAKTYSVDWGDGTTSAAQSSATFKHTYPANTKAAGNNDTYNWTATVTQ